MFSVTVGGIDNQHVYLPLDESGNPLPVLRVGGDRRSHQQALVGVDRFVGVLQMLGQILLEDHRLQDAVGVDERQETATVPDHEVVGFLEVVDSDAGLYIGLHALGNRHVVVPPGVEVLVGDDAEQAAVKVAGVGYWEGGVAGLVDDLDDRADRLIGR